MEDSALTSLAIAELMRDLPGISDRTTLEPQERKVNPLGKPNKRFLDRTLNNVLRHNKREIERNQASCQQKLKELDDRYRSRQRNAYYNSNARNRSESRERHARKSRPKKKKHKRRRRSSRSSSSSRSRSTCKNTRESRSSSSCSRSRDSKTKHKKRKYKKNMKRRRSNSRSREKKLPTTSFEYKMYSNNLALAVAMAYNQALSTQQPQNEATPPPLPDSDSTPALPDSPSSDIVRELMSDEETNQQPQVQPDALSIASSRDDVGEILTIDLSSQDELSANTSESESQIRSPSGSCISLTDSVEDDLVTFIGSDREIIESESEQPQDTPVECINLSDEDVESSTYKTNTVDLTED